jgi:hypothetical protein
MQSVAKPPLYDRLGGVYSIATVVDDFIDRIMVDPRLNANPLVDEAHQTGAKAPPVRVTLPDGTVVKSGQRDLDQMLSKGLKREVKLSALPDVLATTAEEYWPDIEGNIAKLLFEVKSGSTGWGSMPDAHLCYS